MDLCSNIMFRGWIVWVNWKLFAWYVDPSWYFHVDELKTEHNNSFCEVMDNNACNKIKNGIIEYVKIDLTFRWKFCGILSKFPWRLKHDLPSSMRNYFSPLICYWDFQLSLGLVSRDPLCSFLLVYWLYDCKSVNLS